MSEYEYVIELRNTSTISIKVIVEPWGNEYDLATNAIARIGFKGRVLKTIPIDHQHGCIVVEGVEGIELTGIWIDGILVG